MQKVCFCLYGSFGLELESAYIDVSMKNEKSAWRSDSVMIFVNQGHLVRFLLL